MELTKQEFIDRFTQTEVLAILTQAKTDVQIEMWLFRFNNVTDLIDSIDLRTVSGLNLLEAKGILTEQRVEEICGTSTSYAGFTLGQMVTLLPPFNASYSDQYPIEALDPVANAITVNGSGFDPIYVQAV